MPKNTYIKVAGIWKTVTNIWRNNSGSWSDKVVSWINIYDFWKDCMTYPTPPATPTGLGISQPIMGDYLQADWGTSEGATGYILQRKPWWTGATWEDTWITVYTGVNNTYNDHVDADNPDDQQLFDYHVLAYNGDGNSAYSSTVSYNWSAP